MRATTLIGTALSVLLVSGLSNAEVQGRTGTQQGMMKADSTMQTGMMPGMAKGMMGTGQQKGMMRGPGGKMMGMNGTGKGMMGMHPSGGMMGRMMDPLHGYVQALVHASGWLSKLELSDQDRAKLEAIRTSFLKRKVDAKAVMEKTRIDLNSAVSAKAQPQKIKQLLEKYYQTKLNLQLDAYSTVQQIRNVLPPEQQKILDGALKGAGSCPGCKGMMMGKHGMMQKP